MEGYITSQIKALEESIHIFYLKYMTKEQIYCYVFIFLFCLIFYVIFTELPKYVRSRENDIKLFSKSILNKIRKNPLPIPCIVILITTLFPPYIYRLKGVIVSRVWGFLFWPPAQGSFSMEIDLSTLFVEYILIAALFVLVMSFIMKKDIHKSSKSINNQNNKTEMEDDNKLK